MARSCERDRHRARLVHDLLRAEERRELDEGFIEARCVTPRSEHFEPARFSVEARLDTADQSVADKHGKDVVAVLTLPLRHVHLEAVAEVPECLGPVAVLDQPVEGRKHGDALGNWVVRDLRMQMPAAALPPDAERAAAALLEHALRL